MCSKLRIVRVRRMLSIVRLRSMDSMTRGRGRERERQSEREGGGEGEELGRWGKEEKKEDRVLEDSELSGQYVTIRLCRISLTFCHNTLSNYRRTTFRRHCTTATVAAFAANVIAIVTATVATADERFTDLLILWFWWCMPLCTYDACIWMGF